MEDDNRTIVEMPEHESHGTIIVKWIQILFVCEIVRVVLSVLSTIPEIPSFTGWISRVVSVAAIASLFNLAVVNVRYRKAAIFYCISVGGSIVLSLLHISALTIVLSICSIIASFQELNAHSEITATRNARLSERWHSLFYLEMFAGIIVVFLGMIPAIIAVFAGVDTDVITSIMAIILALVNIAVRLLHVMYLKQTVDLYDK